MPQTREKLTAEEWQGIFDQTARAYLGMIAELKGKANWEFNPGQEWWVIDPRLLDQLPAMEQERGRAILRIASCVAHRSLA